MSKILLTGPASDPYDGIIDAEFEEIAEDGEPSQTQASPPPNYTIGEWLIDMHPAKAAFVVTVAIALFIGFVSAVSGSGGSSDAIDTTAETTTADQMFAEWSRTVTGQPISNGFNLVDGTGTAGVSCDEGSGSHLLQFGRAGEKTPIAIDVFTMQTAGSDIGMAGAFWFNNQTNELLIRNAQAIDLKHKKDHPVPDKIFRITGGGDGTVQLDGVAYHFCVLTQ